MSLPKRFRPLLFSFALLTGCANYADKLDNAKITSINIIDRNGLSETINSKDRLNAFEKTNFLAPQPYQKVLRLFGREKNGDVRSCITSYHPNGQIKQCLEAVNNRALGNYREWHPNGKPKVEATIIGGTADINTMAEQSWIFDGTNRAWDENGALIAEIRYEKGELEGESIYYHPNGRIWRICPYKQNKMHGEHQIFLENGELFQTISYIEGEKHGEAIRYWSPSQIAYKEIYDKGLLIEGIYHTPDFSISSSIRGGNGHRAIFGKERLCELHEYQNGVQQGSVEVYDDRQNLVALYSIKEGEKDGEEICYFPGTRQPKLQLSWHNGVLQGTVKTWYVNGQLESQREVSANQKQGFLTAWYKNGALMLIEEYEQDRLIKGEYYRMGEKTPISQVERGKGTASLFNPDGNFSQKVYYQDGKPIDT